MNIFYLSKNHEVAAEMHCDKHCVKMILEYAQMLSTAHRVLDENVEKPTVLYKIAHKNHPSTVWVRENKQQYMYMFNLFESLSDQYTSRYGKVHLSWKKLGSLLGRFPENITDAGWREPPQCMPDYCKGDSAVAAYRKYYVEEKSHFAKWNFNTVPVWYTAGLHKNNIGKVIQ